MGSLKIHLLNGIERVRKSFESGVDCPFFHQKVSNFVLFKFPFTTKSSVQRVCFFLASKQKLKERSRYFDSSASSRSRPYQIESLEN